jgi:hypothetical protein
MPIEITWMIPQKILLACGAEPITEDDMHVFIEEFSIILDAADRLTHTVLDLSHVKTIDDAIAYVFYGSRVPEHPRRGRIGMVNANFQGRVQADILNRISGREMFHLFDSRETARTFLLTHDSPAPPFAAGYSEAGSATSAPDTPAPDEATAGNSRREW